MLPILINTLLSGLDVAQAGHQANQIQEPGYRSWYPSYPGSHSTSLGQDKPLYPFVINTGYENSKHQLIMDALHLADPEVLQHFIESLNPREQNSLDPELQDQEPVNVGGNLDQAVLNSGIPGVLSGGDLATLAGKEKRFARYDGGYRWPYVGSFASPTKILRKLSAFRKKASRSGRSRNGILRNFAGYKNNQRYLRFSKRGMRAEDPQTKPFHVKEGQEESISGH